MTRLCGYARTCVLLFMFFVSGLMIKQQATAASFQWLVPETGGQSSQALRLSDDGSTIVGSLFDHTVPNGSHLAVRWNREGSMTFLGDLSGGRNHSVGIGVSADGSVVVGESASTLSALGHDTYTEPFYWTAEQRMTGLGFLPGTNGLYGEASAVSSNGLVVVGQSSGDSGVRAFRWSSANGMLDLGDLTDPGSPTLGFTVATDVSADGSVIVGQSPEGDIDEEGNVEIHPTAFRWTETGGMKSLGVLPGTERLPARQSFARAVSPDGHITVGNVTTTDGIQAFRWTQETGMIGLETTTQHYTDAFDVSADGKIVVGQGDIGPQAGQFRAIAWDQYGSLHLLEDLLAREGLRDQLQGGHLLNATGVSADGQTFVGTGFTASGRLQAWVATLTVPEPSSLLLALTCLAASGVVRNRPPNRR